MVTMGLYVSAHPKSILAFVIVVIKVLSAILNWWVWSQSLYGIAAWRLAIVGYFHNTFT